MPVSDATRRLIQSSVSKNTREAYASVLRALEARLADRPLTDVTVADYITDRFESGLAPSSIEMILSAIKFASRLSGKSAPLGLLTEKTLNGIRRVGGSEDQGRLQELRSWRHGSWRDRLQEKVFVVFVMLQ